MVDSRKKPRILYLATFDPTVSATGTSTRGKLFLKFFCANYDTHLVHMREKDADGKDDSLISLTSIIPVDYSNISYFLFSPKLYQAATEILQCKPFDLIFADFEKSGWYAYLLSRKFRVPYIYNSHNVEFRRYKDFARRNALRYPLVPYMHFVEKTACKNALFTVAISEEDAKIFKRWVPEEKVLAMPCAFDESIVNPFYKEVRTRYPIILIVGNYRNPGNREGAYLMYKKVLPDVLRKYPETIFRFIGKNFPGDIQHRNIESPGFVNDLMSEYKKATAVVVPIAMGGGIKIKTIEGLACGKFVISTQKGIEGIDISSLVNLKVLAIEQFADCIINVISKPIEKTTRNWNKIEKAYGIKHQLSEIKERITLYV